MKIKLEPFIFLAIFGWAAMNSAQVRTKLLLWKICEIDLGYEEALCKNISSNATVESKVQIKANEFEMVNDWLSKVYNIKKQTFLHFSSFYVYSGEKNKRHKPDFPYKIGIFKRLLRDKNVGELLIPSKGQTKYTRRT